ncbi:hypothetical protein NL108_006887, partial [Boleophthalmus pectinirostris]
YISLYYVAFYIVMTALFSLAIYVLMYTLSPYAPDYQDRLKSPGNATLSHINFDNPHVPITNHITLYIILGVMVWPDTYGEEIVEISYNSSDKKSWKKMATILRHFLEPYNDTTQLIVNNVTCTKGKYFIQSHFTGHNHTKCSCPFTQSMLGPCSGLEDPTFGYNSSMPCVIIKMNRIINFLPSNITGVAPYVNCTILDGEENVENIEYFPKNGTMDLSYFPYYGRLAQ